MENETFEININRQGFPTLVEVEDYIKNVFDKYKELGMVFIRNYSNIEYNNGSWNAHVTLTSRDPNSVQTATEATLGNW